MFLPIDNYWIILILDQNKNNEIYKGNKMIVIEPIHKNDANKIVKSWHRHNKPVPQSQITFCFGIWGDAPGYKLLGVVIVGEPCGRPKGKDRNLILEVRRVCFRPGIDFKKIKRWYPTEDNQPYPDSPTLRNLPIVVRHNGIPIAYDLTTAYKIPSKIMDYVIFFTKRYFTNIKKIWTYILKKENGKYLEEAGYICDKVFKRRNRWKRRYTKYVE